jgi:alpha-L-fucosidase
MRTAGALPFILHFQLQGGAMTKERSKIMITKTTPALFVFLLWTGGQVVWLSSAGAAETNVHYEANWASLDRRPAPEWYLDAKFGIFIHWGVYSVPAWGPPKTYAEWYWHNIANRKEDNPWWQFHKRTYGESFAYPEFASRFRAELFKPDDWAGLFARAGAKYIVPTSKHHDGFCLWPSAEANRTWGRPWNSVDTGPRRDLLGELKTAVEKRGIRFGFYYSFYEWFNPLWLKDRARYVTEHMMPQFKDVVTRYAPALIFCDGEWEMPSKDWKSEELLAWLYNDSPCKDYVIVNDRWGKETRHHHGGYFTTEYGAGLKDAAHPWEENRGMGYSYGYNRAEDIDDYKSGRELVMVLIDLISRGGNFLLDVGPTGDGRIPVIMQQRLVEIGDWLEVNGEAIYGTRYAGRDCQWSEGKRPGQDYGEFKVKYNLMDQIGQKPKGDLAVKQAFFTKKSGALYAIIPGWPPNPMVLRNVRVPSGSEVTLLGRPGQVIHEVKNGDLILHPPDLHPGEAPCRYAYTFKITGAELRPESP